MAGKITEKELHDSLKNNFNTTKETINQLRESFNIKLLSDSTLRGDFFNNKFYTYYDTMDENKDKKDNTLDLQILIDKCYEQGGGYIDIGEGVFKISNTINMKPGVKLRGQGMDITILKLDTTNSIDSMIVFDGCGASGMVDMSIHGSYKKCNGITITSLNKDYYKSFPIESWITLQNVSINYLDGDGLVHKGIAWMCNINNIIVRQCTGFGYNISVTDQLYTNINAFDCAKGAINNSGSNNRFIGGKLFCNGSKTNNEETYTLIAGGYRNSFVGLDIQDNYGGGIKVLGEYNCFTGCIVDSCGVLNVKNGYSNVPYDKIGIYVSYGIGHIFSSCVVTNYLFSDSNTKQKRGVVVDNNCLQCNLGIIIDLAGRIENALSYPSINQIKNLTNVSLNDTFIKTVREVGKIELENLNKYKTIVFIMSLSGAYQKPMYIPVSFINSLNSRLLVDSFYKSSDYYANYEANITFENGCHYINITKILTSDFFKDTFAIQIYGMYS